MRYLFGFICALALGLMGCSETSGTGGNGGHGGGGGNASPGCEDGTLDETVTSVDLQFEGVPRAYEIHVPPAYDGRTPLPLVLNVHGYGGSTLGQRFWTQMDETADARGYVVVYPEGRDESWNAGVCCGPSAENEVDDVCREDVVSSCLIL